MITHSHTKTLPDGRKVDILKLIKATNTHPIKQVSLTDISGASNSRKSGFSKSRYEKTDTQYPLLITKDKFLLDGRHRYFKLKNNGETTAPARIVNSRLLNEAATRVEKTAAPFKYPSDLKPYQIRTLKRITDPATSGLVIAHGTGTGKTRQAIEATNALKMPTNVVVPAALQGNYRKELKKWSGGTPDNVNIMSQQRVARQGLKSNPNSLLIVDEAHRARENSSALYNTLRKSQAKKRLFLTATPVFNHPKDLSTIVNLAAGKPVLPTDKTDFDQKYINYRKVKPGLIQRLGGVTAGVIPEVKNSKELGKILNKYVDYYPGSSEGFPKSDQETVHVPMGNSQTQIYKSILGTAPWWMRQKVKWGLPPGKGEFDKMRAFLNGARQVSNTNRAFVRGKSNYDEVKIRKAFDYLQDKVKTDPSYKGVVYSNYLQSGLSPYKDYLDKSKIPYGEFSGDIGSKDRDELVRQYNANKIKALLISSAGAEGLDLKGTRLIQILEPHFNEEKEKQIIGRGIRYGSHAHLPVAQRHVQVQRYIADPQQGLVDRIFKRKTHGTDEYIRNLALQKSKLTDQITGILNEQNKNLR